MEGLAGWGGVSGFGDLPGWLVSFTEALVPGPAVDDGPGRRPWRCRGAGGRALGAPRPGWSPLSPGPRLQGVQAQEQHHLQRQRHSVLPGVPQLPVPAPQVPRPGERLHSHPQHPGHGEAAPLPPPPRPEGARLSCPGCPLARTAWGSRAGLSACRTARRPPPPRLCLGVLATSLSLPFRWTNLTPPGGGPRGGGVGAPRPVARRTARGVSRASIPCGWQQLESQTARHVGRGPQDHPGPLIAGRLQGPSTRSCSGTWVIAEEGAAHGQGGAGTVGRQARAPRAPRDSQGTHLIPQQWV